MSDDLYEKIDAALEKLGGKWKQEQLFNLSKLGLSKENLDKLDWKGIFTKGGYEFKESKKKSSWKKGDDSDGIMITI